MSTGLCQPNSTQIPNEVFDHWMAILTPAEFKVLLCICRKTYGWRKYRDSISMKQISQLTGLSRPGVFKNVESLIEHGLITKHKSKTTDGDDAPNTYEIKVCVNSVGGGGKLSIPPVVNSVDQGVVNSVDTQKKLYTKETNTKEESGIKDAPSELSLGLVDLFFNKIQEIDPKAKEPNRTKWAEVIDKMHRIDKRSYEQIEAIIEFAHNDPFWSTNILCAETLRKNSTKLIAKMRVSKPTVSPEEKKERNNLEIVEEFILTHTRHFQNWCCVKLHHRNGIPSGIELKNGEKSQFLKLTDGGVAEQLDNFRRTALNQPQGATT